ncbi:hypothetical protein AAFN86_28805 [Roseomonas sp. CAU 1739]
MPTGQVVVAQVRAAGPDGSLRYVSAHVGSPAQPAAAIAAGEPVNRNDKGQWAKGQSGRPKGWRRQDHALPMAELCRKYAADAPRIVWQIMLDAAAPPSARLAAAQFLTERGYGRVPAASDAPGGDMRAMHLEALKALCAGSATAVAGTAVVAASAAIEARQAAAAAEAAADAVRDARLLAAADAEGREARIIDVATAPPRPVDRSSRAGGDDPSN